LLEVIDKATGDVVKRNPRHLTSNSTASIEVTLQRPVCLDTFKESKELGRFMLRKGGKTVAAGIITEVSYFITFFNVFVSTWN
jgi:translation elongation factor EF-1alpha